MYADVTGKPRLDMKEVHEYRDKVNMVAGKKKDEELVVFAPMQIAQLRKVVASFLFSSTRACSLASRSVFALLHSAACRDALACVVCGLADDRASNRSRT